MTQEERMLINSNAKRVGNICEIVATLKFLKKGWNVSVPYGDNCRYDLIVDKKDGTLYRAQVKSACRPKEKNNEVISIPLETKNKSGYIRYDSNDVDVFIAVDLITENIYWIPFSDTNNQRVFKLRLSGGKYNTNGVNWAKDYEII